MNLALVLGHSSENIKPKLISVKDNLNIECFVTLKQFISVSIKREMVFDRAIIISSLFDDKRSIDELYDFWSNYCNTSEFILLGRSKVDEGLAKTFLSKFCSTYVTCMLVTSTTLSVLNDAVVLPTAEITNAYGIPDYLAVEVETDVAEPEKEPEPEPEPVPEKNSNTSSKKKEKHSLLGGIFGKRKKKGTEQNTQNSDINDEPVTDENTVKEVASVPQPKVKSIPVPKPVREEVKPINQPEPPIEDDTFDDSVEDFPEPISMDFSDIDESTSSSLNETDVPDDFIDEVEEEVTEPSDNPYEEYDSDYPNEETVSDDFGDLSCGMPEDTESNDYVNESSQEEVEDVDSLMVGADEEEYRQKTEKPKVIKETVVKEVIKSIKTSNVLENIKKGYAHKVIIVTGDRGSGVTTLAWSLLSYFCSRVPVLYFDCDVEKHGLMNYIDYFEFKNYEEAHMKGVKLCRNSNAFKSCVCRWNTNVDLLTSDFGVDISDDELILTQGIVAEKIDNYGVVVVDCPISRLHCLQDLILTGTVAICVEDSKRGYMNTLISLEESSLPLRYKRNIASRGTMLRTKVNKKNDYKRTLAYINSIVDLDECDWFNMQMREFNGKLSPELLTDILEG